MVATGKRRQWRGGSEARGQRAWVPPEGVDWSCAMSEAAHCSCVSGWCQFEGLPLVDPLKTSAGSRAVRLLRIRMQHAVSVVRCGCETFEQSVARVCRQCIVSTCLHQRAGNAFHVDGSNASRCNERWNRCRRRRGNDPQTAGELGFVPAQQIVHVAVERAGVGVPGENRFDDAARRDQRTYGRSKERCAVRVARKEEPRRLIARLRILGRVRAKRRPSSSRVIFDPTGTMMSVQ